MLELKLIYDCLTEKNSFDQWEDINWQAFYNLISFHRIRMLIAERIDLEKCPPEFRKELKQVNAQLKIASLKLSAEFCQLVKLFQANDLSLIPYKGPVLADRLYENHCLRESGDLDVFIKRDDFYKVVDLLRTNGYQTEFETLNEILLKSHYEMSFKHDKKIQIEIHWRPAPSYFVFDFDMKHTFQKDCEDYQFMQCKFKVLSKEDELLLLIVHGYRHQWFQLRWLLDVIEYVQTDIDWAHFDGLLKRYDLEYVMGATCQLLGATGLDLNEHCLRYRDMKLPSLFQSYTEAIIIGWAEYKSDAYDVSGKGLNDVQRIKYYVSSRKTYRKKLKILFRRLFQVTPIDMETYKLPAYMNFLYPVLRIWRVLIKRPIQQMTK